MSKTKLRSYVFVVCGSAEHINTLNYSIQFLKNRTHLPIYVVTDIYRNEIPIDHTDIISIITPSHLSNHQASIWLKTSLHRHLPPSGLYAYLDSDVLAIGNAVDEIFDQFSAPIIFAEDHCKTNKFSPHAVNCFCIEAKEKVIKAITNAYKNVGVNPSSELNQEAINEIQFGLGRIKSTSIGRFKLALRFNMSWPIFYLNKKYYFDKRNKSWYNSSGEFIQKQVDMKKLAQKLGLRWDENKNEILNLDGNTIYDEVGCNHLIELIKSKFDVIILDETWQHWNGGVFLFNDESHDFMDTWHEFSTRIFDDKAWKCRDQGTLIACAWKFNIQHQPVLGEKWNYIADYNNPDFFIDEKGTALCRNGIEVSPEFIHVYHHFGDADWDIWRWVSSKKQLHF